VRELLTYEDVARLTKFKISTLRKWVQLRKIPFSKINGSIRFDPEELRAWAAGERRAGKSGGVAAPVGGAGELFPDAGEERQ
jgi:excisionase family DNA binding protein